MAYRELAETEVMEVLRCGLVAKATGPSRHSHEPPEGAELRQGSTAYELGAESSIRAAWHQTGDG